MSEEPTRNLPRARSFEERVLAELAAIRNSVDGLRSNVDELRARQDRLEVKFDRLEERVERRLMETRPIWEAVLMEVRRINTKHDHLVVDLYNLRTDVTELTRRVDAVEKA